MQLVLLVPTRCISCSTGRRGTWNLFPFPEGTIELMFPEDPLGEHQIHFEGNMDYFIKYLCQRGTWISRGEHDLCFPCLDQSEVRILHRRSIITHEPSPILMLAFLGAVWTLLLFASLLASSVDGAWLRKSPNVLGAIWQRYTGIFCTLNMSQTCVVCVWKASIFLSRDTRPMQSHPRTCTWLLKLTELENSLKRLICVNTLRVGVVHRTHKYKARRLISQPNYLLCSTVKNGRWSVGPPPPPRK